MCLIIQDPLYNYPPTNDVESEKLRMGKVHHLFIKYMCGHCLLIKVSCLSSYFMILSDLVSLCCLKLVQDLTHNFSVHSNCSLHLLACHLLPLLDRLLSCFTWGSTWWCWK